MGFKLNPDAVEFFPASGHRRGKRADWRWTSVSKQQIRYAGGDERCGRRRVGLLNPLSGETHKQGMYLDRWTKQKMSVSTIGGGGDAKIPSPGRAPKQPLPGIGLHDPLHGRQACPEFNSFYQGVGQISPPEGLLS